MIKRIVLLLFVCTNVAAQVPQITVPILDSQGMATGDTVTIDVNAAAKRGSGVALPDADFTIPVLDPQSVDTGDVLSVDVEVSVTYQ